MFCVFNGTLHVAWFTVVFDADMKCASTHPLVDLWAGGGPVIAGLLEPIGDNSFLPNCAHSTSLDVHVTDVRA